MFRFFPTEVCVYVATNERERRWEVCAVNAENWDRVSVVRRPAAVLVFRDLRQKERERN